MATVKKNRTVQTPLVAEFVMNVGSDSMTDTSGNLTAFKAAAGVFDVIGLPPNAVVVGGDMTVETASDDSGTATVSIGDSANATRYLAATTIKATGRTALGPTGYRGSGEDVRVTFANAGANAANGKISLRVQYIVTGRATEVQIT